MGLTWPLIGRSEEMQTIVAAVSDLDLAGILVSGPAGVGKSRIVREALASVASDGFVARWAVGTTSARKLPLGAFASWAGSGGTDRLQLVRGVIDSVTSAPPGTTVVLGVDDVHLIDELSTFVLHQIVQRAAAKVVLTVRDGERVPTEIYEVWKGGQFERLDLQPLSDDEVAELLAATLGGPVDPDAATRLWKLTRGNALYLRNIVEQAVLLDHVGRLEARAGEHQLPAQRGAFRAHRVLRQRIAVADDRDDRTLRRDEIADRGPVPVEVVEAGDVVDVLHA